MKNEKREREYSIKELSKMKSFPWRERTIRAMIAKGLLRANYYGYERIAIPESAIEEFLNKQQEMEKESAKSKKMQSIAKNKKKG